MELIKKTACEVVALLNSGEVTHAEVLDALSARIAGTDSQINLETEHPEFSEWKWMPRDGLIDAIVPFKREVYQQVIEEFEGKV